MAPIDWTLVHLPIAQGGGGKLKVFSTATGRQFGRDLATGGDPVAVAVSPDGRYALVSAKKTEGDSVLYQGLNIIAGVMVVIYTLSLGAYATTGLNAVWAIIGVLTLGRKWLTRN